MGEAVFAERTQSAATFCSFLRGQVEFQPQFSTRLLHMVSLYIISVIKWQMKACLGELIKHTHFKARWFA